jgi:hypothetical protein
LLKNTPKSRNLQRFEFKASLNDEAIAAQSYPPAAVRRDSKRCPVAFVVVSRRFSRFQADSSRLVRFFFCAGSSGENPAKPRDIGHGMGQSRGGKAMKVIGNMVLSRLRSGP